MCCECLHLLQLMCQGMLSGTAVGSTDWLTDWLTDLSSAEHRVRFTCGTVFELLDGIKLCNVFYRISQCEYMAANWHLSNYKILARVSSLIVCWSWPTSTTSENTIFSLLYTKNSVHVCLFLVRTYAHRKVTSCLIKHHALKWGNGVRAPHILHLRTGWR